MGEKEAVKPVVYFTDREIKELELAQHYLENFNHGSIGHNQLVLIAKLAKELKQYVNIQIVYTVK